MSPVQERQKIGGSPAESHQDDQGVGEVEIGRKVAGIGCVQPREDSGGSNHSLAIPTR